MQRRFAGQRWLRIALRTVHITAASAYFGALLAQGAAAAWLPVVLASGALLVAEELYRYGLGWLRFVQAWAVGLKLMSVVLASLWPQHALWAALAALVVGSVISHAPGELRQRALWGEPGPCARRGARGSADSEMG